MTLMIELLGILAVIVMVASYALEKRHPRYILVFSIACGFAAVYAYLVKSYPFLVAESIWCIIAFMRWRKEVTKHN